MKKWLALLFAVLVTPAQAQIFASYPYTFQNGTIADATQVNANFNAISSAVNAGAAHNGSNSDITYLTGLIGFSATSGTLSGSLTSGSLTTGNITSTGTLSVSGSTGASGYILTSGGTSAPSWQPLAVVAASSVRQTVQDGPGTGSPSFLPASSGSLSLTSQNISSGTPLIVSAANGFSSVGDINVIGQATSNLSWSSLPASSTVFLGVTVSGGLLTPFFTSTAPIYQYGGAISSALGQYTFDIAQMMMYVGNGSSSSQVNAVFVGEAVTGGSSVTSTVAYQYNGYYDSGWTALPGTSTAVSKNHNIGVAEYLTANLALQNVTAEEGYSTGDIVSTLIQTILVNTAGGAVPLIIWNSRNLEGFTTGAYWPFQLNPKLVGGTSTNTLITSANWKYKLTAKRNF